MDALRATLLATLLFAPALSGCFGDDEPPVARSISDSGGVLSQGFAYDGQGLERVGATLEGQVNRVDDTGSVTVNFQFAGSSWSIVFDSFSGTSDFQDGGVAFDLVEHGATGVADTSIPEILALIAAWGSATVSRDGEPYPDPGTGETGPWNAHLMIAANSVRQADGRITNADQSAPYDPGSPDDAFTTGDDPQAIFWVKAPSGEDNRREPVTQNQTFTFQGPPMTETMEVPAGSSSEVTINVTTVEGEAPLHVGNATVRVLDGDGNELAAEEGAITPTETFEATLSFADAPGPLTVELSGQGAFELMVSAHVTFEDYPFLVFTWDDPTVEAVEG